MNTFLPGNPLDTTNTFVTVNDELIRLSRVFRFVAGQPMPRKPSTQPNDVELSILRVLWDRGPSSVRQVHEVLQLGRDAGYTTTLKMMQVMCVKGLLKRDESTRPQIYRPSVSEEHTQRHIMRELLQKVFAGSTRKMVLRAVESGQIKGKELAEIRKLLENIKGEER